MGGVLSNAAQGAATGSMFMPGWGTAIGAGVGVLTGALSGLFGTDSEQSKATKDLMDRIKALEGYSQSDMSRDVSSINRAGTTTMTNAANTFALGAGGRQNFMNASMGRVVEQESQVGNQRMFQMEDYNKKLDTEKLSMEASLIGGLSPDTGQENFLSTMNLGMQGLSAGMQFDKSPLNNFTTSDSTNPSGTYGGTQNMWSPDPTMSFNTLNPDPISTSLSKGDLGGTNPWAQPNVNPRTSGLRNMGRLASTSRDNTQYPDLSYITGW